MANLAEMMIMYRARHDLNQEELANRCGVSKQTIYSIENGLQNPSKKTTMKILLVVAPKKSGGN